MTIELICPSRGRPDAAAALLASFRATAVLDTTLLLFAVDSDDPTRDRYPQPHVVIGPPTGDPTGPLNRLALASSARIVGFIGDDSRLTTKGWDREVELALKEPGFAWGDDETGPPVWPSTAFCTTDIIRAIGYFVLPSLKRGFFDRQWISVARAAGVERPLRSHFPHDNYGKAVAKDIIDADAQAFAAYGVAGVNADAAKARLVYDLVHFFRPQDLAA